jgi:16S rRNA (uracil1498-N3)-methyltransferase
VDNIDRKEATLILKDCKLFTTKPKRELNIAWCVVEPKNIERVLPTLNELGVASLYFIYCRRSQKNFKIDFKRLDRILLNSSQQSGRGDIMKVEILERIEDFLELYPNAKMLNFCDNPLSHRDNINAVVVGSEGGFSDDEVSLFSKDNIVGLDTPMVLRSESAVCGVASKILL